MAQLSITYSAGMSMSVIPNRAEIHILGAPAVGSIGVDDFLFRSGARQPAERNSERYRRRARQQQAAQISRATSGLRADPLPRVGPLVELDIGAPRVVDEGQPAAGADWA